MKKFYHPYHLVSYSPWPLMLSLSIMIFLVGSLKWMCLKEKMLMLYGLFLILLILFQWWRDVIREGVYIGFHSIFVINGIKFGMLLFILSEVMFFVSFFWGYFHMFLSPSIDIGMNWYPKDILPFDSMGIPFLNTSLLIVSGMFITLSHMYFFKNKKFSILLNLLITIILGLQFSLMQLIEYNESFFSINDSVLGSLFFILTGFHGLHVLIGTMFLIFNFVRLLFSEFSLICHIGFELSAWYWHFVDLVWLFLYVILYWN